MLTLSAQVFRNQYGAVSLHQSSTWKNEDVNTIQIQINYLNISTTGDQVIFWSMYYLIYICGYVKSKQGCSISLGEKNNSITFLFMAFYKEYHNSACFLVN